MGEVYHSMKVAVGTGKAGSTLDLLVQDVGGSKAPEFCIEKNLGSVTTKSRRMPRKGE